MEGTVSKLLKTHKKQKQIARMLITNGSKENATLGLFRNSLA